MNVSFILDDLQGWYDYANSHQPFELRSDKLEIGPETRYKAFVGYDPEGYFLEFNLFLPHDSNERLLQYLQ